MAWRFKASKFKNTAAKQPKREDCIIDLPIGTLTCSNNGVQASASLMAFHIEAEGGKLGLLPLTAKGRRLRQDLGVICAHADAVTDFQFLPFNDRTLVTCSRDDKVKLWSWDENANFPATVGNPTASIDLGSDRLTECLSCHPTAADVLAVGAGEGAAVCDLQTQKCVIDLTGLSDRALASSWHDDGKLLAVQDRSHQAAIFDPRAGTEPIYTAKTHTGMGREGRILFLGNTDKLLTTGFSVQRCQQAFLYDVRNFSTPIHKEELGPSTGIVMPLYDPDTKLLFLAGKGSTKVGLCELAERPPLISQVSVYQSPEQTLGACLVPKAAMNVMEGEVQRLIQLTKHTIYPVPCIVPRRTYRDFLPELFPDTVCQLPGCSSDDWLNGCDSAPPKFSLEPSKNSLINVSPVQNGVPPVETKTAENVQNGTHEEQKVVENAKENEKPVPEVQPEVKSPEKPPAFVPPDPDTPSSHTQSSSENNQSPPSPPAPVAVKPPTTPPAKKEAALTPVLRTSTNRMQRRERPKTCVIGVKQSKYRHCETICGGKLGQFINLRKLNTRMPLESDGFCVSNKWAAVPLAGPGGVICILENSSPKKLADGVIPGLENKDNVMDLRWSPFDDDVIAAACESGVVNIWRVPEEGVTTLDLVPEKVVQASTDKLIGLRWHPIAENLMAIASQDRLSIWDISGENPEAKINLEGHTQALLSFAWSAGGKRLVTAARDSYLRIYEPRNSTRPIAENKVLESTRAVRVLFVCDDRMILVVNFSRRSDRQLSVFCGETLNHMHTIPVDTSPQLLIPHYDYDSSVVILAAKGDRMLHMYEVCTEDPWLMKLNPFMAPSNHQAISLYHKNACDVRAVEFAHGWRLTDKTCEQLSFKVPRIKKDLFQNDLFPDALATWLPVLTAQEWFDGSEAQPDFVSLKPDGMDLHIPVSSPKKLLQTKPKTEAEVQQEPVVVEPEPESIQQEPKRVKQDFDEADNEQRMIDRDAPETKKELVGSLQDCMADISPHLEDGLEQDKMEGVEESEWNE